MQPYFMPYIGYFQLINAVDKFVIYDDVNYINRGWVNRNQVLINGNPSMITVPLKESSQNRLINEIEVSYDEKWKEKMLRTIEMSYRRAPFFLNIYTFLKEILFSNYRTIAELNVISINMVCKYLEINTTLDLSSTYYNSDLSGQERIIDICQKEGANNYINPKGGQNLYSKEEFLRQKIKLEFIKPLDITYLQFANEFQPCLSIIDLLMFNDVDSIKDLLGQYKLI